MGARAVGDSTHARSHARTRRCVALAPFGVGSRTRGRSLPWVPPPPVDAPPGGAFSLRRRFPHPWALASVGARTPGHFDPWVLPPSSRGHSQAWAFLPLAFARAGALMKCHSDEISSHSAVHWIQDPFPTPFPTRAVRSRFCCRFLPDTSARCDIDRNNAGRAEMDWVRAGIARGRKTGGSIQC